MLNFFKNRIPPVIEFHEFGTFDYIHAYFRDQYLENGASEDFLVRIQHFFRALQAVLEGKGAPKFKILLESSSSYRGVYGQAFRQSFHGPDDEESVTRVMVENYLLKVVEKIQASSVEMSKQEKEFYQIFLAKLAFPILFNPGLSYEAFQTILKNISGEKLLHQQEESWENGHLRDSQLFLQLRRSTHRTAIGRYCKIVSRFPEQSDARYQLSVEILRSIQSKKSSSVNDDILRRNPSLAADIFRTLLLSVRPIDQQAVYQMLNARIKDTAWMANILCDADFLESFRRTNLRGQTASNSVRTFYLLRDAFRVQLSKDNPVVTSLNHIVSHYVSYNDKQPLVDVTALTNAACADFFGMLSPEAAKQAYTQEICQAILKQLSTWPDSFGKEDMISIMRFISQCLYPDRSKNLLEFCGRICAEGNQEIACKKASDINGYLATQMLLYPNAETKNNYVLCVNQLRNQFKSLGKLIENDTVEIQALNATDLIEQFELTTPSNPSGLNTSLPLFGARHTSTPSSSNSGMTFVT